MKFIFLIVTIITLIRLECIAQSDTLKFKDGTIMSYDIITSNPDEMKRFSVYASLNWNHSRLSYLGVTYYRPKLFFVNAYGLGNIMGIDGTLFLKSYVKEIAAKITLKSSTYGDIKESYHAKIPAKKKVSFGINFVSNYKTISILDSSKAMEVGIGLGRIVAKKVKFNLQGGYKNTPILNVEVLNGVYCDFMTYPKIIFPNGEENNTSPFGARLFFQGMSSNNASQKIRWGINYNIGIGFANYTGIYGIVGFGVYFHII